MSQNVTISGHYAIKSQRFSDVTKTKLTVNDYKSSPPEVLLGKAVLKICSIFIRKPPMPKSDFNKVPLQLD